MRHFQAFMILGMTAAAAPAAALDSCLAGVWEADAADMAHVMQSQTGSPVTHVSGRVSLEITEFGVLTMLAEDLVFEMQVPNIPPVQVEVVGYTHGAMNADDGVNFHAVAAEYSLVGAADVLGQRMEIPINTATAGWGNARGTYGCTAGSVAFDPDQLGSFPRRFRRVR